MLTTLAMPQESPDWKARAQCPASVRDGSRRCSNSVLYLGGDAFASACCTHASDDERQRHRRHQVALTTATVIAGDTQCRHLRDLSHDIANDWLQRRPE